MLSLSAISFAIATILSGHLASLCFRPPNPNPNASQAWAKDSVGFFIAHSRSVLACRLISFGSGLLHAVVTLLLDCGAVSPPRFLNQDLFHWTWTALLGFLFLFVGAAMRLAAFGALGRRFTFALAKPDELNTKGIYAYIQHPSYTGIVLVSVSIQMLFVRWDGWPAYFISQNILGSLRGWGFLCHAVAISMSLYSLGRRVYDEEAMLKEVFGDKWVAWHRRTKRFIPGVI
ncbi:hypothetical protein E4U54_003244 [Claviceps lovelessii]|nr:hypothetical protein E4U54_003244 [Claviceps lovelessii]